MASRSWLDRLELKRIGLSGLVDLSNSRKLYIQAAIQASRASLQRLDSATMPATKKTTAKARPGESSVPQGSPFTSAFHDE